MAGPFEIATKAAIQEILERHVQSSKFGSFLSSTSQSAMIDDVYELLLTSRKLKTVGDRVLAGQMPGGNTKQVHTRRTITIKE